MHENGYQGQLRADDQINHCFEANQELMPLIQNSCKYQNIKLFKIGIATNNPFEIVYLNNESIRIGSTHHFQLNDVDIQSIYFANDTNSEVITDYIIMNRDG